MSDDVTPLLREIRDRLPESKSGVDKFLHLMEKLLLPAAVAFLAFTTDQASTRLATAQLDLQRERAQTEKSLRYLDLVYGDITGGAEASERALALVTELEPTLGLKLTDVIRGGGEVTEATLSRIDRVEEDLRLIQALESYKVGIYFDEASEAQGLTAQSLQRRLQAFGLRGPVQLYPQSAQWLAQAAIPTATEIRYESGFEQEQFRALEGVLGRLTPPVPATGRTVANRTANFISIFLAS